MRKNLQKLGWAGALAPLLLLAGCCSNPGVFGQIDASMRVVQGFYDPLISNLVDQDTDSKVRLAVVAADAALLMAGTLQDQWCPDPKTVEQLALQAEAAKRLAAEAGVSQTK